MRDDAERQTKVRLHTILYPEKAISEENGVIAPIFGKRLATAYLSLGENEKAVKVKHKCFPGFSEPL